MGVQDGSTYKERHAIFVRATIEIIEEHQWKAAKQPDGTMAMLTFSPLTVLLDGGDRFEKVLGTRRMLVTSLHVPPFNKKTKQQMRDRELVAILHGYPAMPSLRLGTPFLKSEAATMRVKKPIHVLAGDFQQHPRHYPLARFGWSPPLVASEYMTGPTQKTFDNVLVDVEV